MANKRKWYRRSFSLRAFLIFVLVTGAISSWLAHRIYRVRQHQQGIVWVESQNGECYNIVGNPPLYGEVGNVLVIQKESSLDLSKLSGIVGLKDIELWLWADDAEIDVRTLSNLRGLNTVCVRWRSSKRRPPVNIQDLRKSVSPDVMLHLDPNSEHPKGSW